MKTIFTIALLSLFTVISAQEIKNESTNQEIAPVQIEQVNNKEVSEENTEEASEEVARLFKRKNSLIKRELKLYTPAKRSKLA